MAKISITTIIKNTKILIQEKPTESLVMALVTGLALWVLTSFILPGIYSAFLGDSLKIDFILDVDEYSGTKPIYVVIDNNGGYPQEIEDINLSFSCTVQKDIQTFGKGEFSQPKRRLDPQDDTLSIIYQNEKLNELVNDKGETCTGGVLIKPVLLQANGVSKVEKLLAYEYYPGTGDVQKKELQLNQPYHLNLCSICFLEATVKTDKHIYSKKEKIIETFLEIDVETSGSTLEKELSKTTPVISITSDEFIDCKDDECLKLLCNIINKKYNEQVCNGKIYADCDFPLKNGDGIYEFNTTSREECLNGK